MTNPSAALAIFVKTPEMSPIKTRLAAGIGSETALAFYRRSLEAVAATAAFVQSAGVVPYWAIAERDGLEHPLWQSFRRTWQGNGELGDRLARVFSYLGQSYQFVVAIGADSPQITPELVTKALRVLANDDRRAAHVLGRCHDGGFYLVGTSAAPPPQTWHGVPYSTVSAAERMAANLAALGNLAELEPLTDVDRAEDLHLLRDELAAVENPSAEQIALLCWLTCSQLAN